MQKKLSILFLLTTVSSISVLPAQAQMTGGFDEYQSCQNQAQSIYSDCLEDVPKKAAGSAAAGAILGAGAGLLGGPLGVGGGALLGTVRGFSTGGHDAELECGQDYMGNRSTCNNQGGYSMTTPGFFPEYSRDTDGDGMDDQSYYY